jgi:hypothetical protein
LYSEVAAAADREASLPFFVVQQGRSLRPPLGFTPCIGGQVYSELLPLFSLRRRRRRVLWYGRLTSERAFGLPRRRHLADRRLPRARRPHRAERAEALEVVAERQEAPGRLPRRQDLVHLLQRRQPEMVRLHSTASAPSRGARARTGVSATGTHTPRAFEARPCICIHGRRWNDGWLTLWLPVRFTWVTKLTSSFSMPTAVAICSM